MTAITSGQDTRAALRVANQLLGKEFFSTLKSEYFQAQEVDGTDAVVTADETNVLDFGGGRKIFSYNVAEQTVVTPAAGNAGLNIAGDQTDDDGFEFSFGLAGDANIACGKTVGTDDPFYIKATLTIADVSGTDELLVGFRKNADCAAAISSYTDYAFLNVNAGDVTINTRKNNNAAPSPTDTDIDVADAGTVTLEVRVDADGNAKFFVNGSDDIESLDFTFDSGDVLIPVIRILQASDLTGDVTLSDVEFGFLS